MACGPKGHAISIHALLAESDHAPNHSPCLRNNFYPRSPCGERPYIMIITICTASFLSTLSLRRATCLNIFRPVQVFYFYPRSPCGERQRTNSFPHAPPQISIHALLAESDQPRKTEVPGAIYFYPRSPCGERPQLKPPIKTHRQISIHALLAESDAPNHNPCSRSKNFYPRSPCGERRCYQRL